MSSTDFILNAKARDNVGKGASRRLRRLANEVPAIIYGGTKNEKPQSISLAQNEFAHSLENEAFFSHIITIDVEGKTQDVILKDLQRHPAKPIILHADFLRVSKTQALTVKVPLHFINEDICVGIKMSGGSAAHSMNELEITCLPADLPEYIEVDVANVDIGQNLHISDAKLPKGVESVVLAHGEGHDLPIFTVNAPKAAADEAEGTEEASAADTGEEESGEE